VTCDSGAWRVAKLSEVAAAASVVVPRAAPAPPEEDLTAAPDVDAERLSFAAAIATAKHQRREREDAYREVEASAVCSNAARYEDPREEVIDYLHPAPPGPTPQLPAADLHAVNVAATGDQICVLFELLGKPRPGTTFEVSIESPAFNWGRSGFRQEFEVELRSDGRALVTSGLDDQRHALPVPGTVGMEGNRVMLVVDDDSFRSGRPLPGSTVPSGPLPRFGFSADVTVVLNPKRYLHDSLVEPGKRVSYPSS
jgi:hypothetical protein